MSSRTSSVWVTLLLSLLVVRFSTGCRAQELREGTSTALLLTPPDSTSVTLHRTLDVCGYDVPHVADLPQWADDWRWRADLNNTGVSEGWAFALDDKDWRFMEIGRTWQSQGETHQGVAWYRRRFNWDSESDVDVCMVFRQMEDSVAVYVNGRPCGNGGGNWADVQIPLTGLVKGLNLLSVRVVNSPTTGDPNRGGIAALADLSAAIPDPIELLSVYDTVVLASDFLLSRQGAHSLREFVRLGGGLLVVFNDPGRSLLDLPLEAALPTFLGHPSSLPGAVRPMPADTSMTGLGIERMAAVDLRAGIYLPFDSRFARPGSHDTKRWNLSPLAYDHMTLVRGNDPLASPILTRCRFGMGTVAACASPDFLLAKTGRLAMRIVLAQVRRAHHEPTPPLAKASGVGEVPWEKLELMGFELTEEPEADIVLIGESGKRGKRALDDALRRGQDVVMTDPGILDDFHQAHMWRPGSRPFAPPQPLTDQATWVSITKNARPRVLTVNLENWAGTDQLSIPCARYGPVRGVWTDADLGRQCADGTWVVTPSASIRRLNVGIWGMDGQERPSVHLGDRAILVTGTGFRLNQPLQRPVSRMPQGDVLWHWEDGHPAVAGVQIGSSLIVSPSVKLEAADPRQIDWADMAGFKARFLTEDTSQLVAWIAREVAAGEQLLPGEFQTDSTGVTFALVSEASTPQSVRLRYRWRDWQRSLLIAQDIELEFEPGGNIPVSVTWPDQSEVQRYYDTAQRDYYWLELAILSPQMDRCLAWVERQVPRSFSRVAIWHSPVQLRSPPLEPATWPRIHDEDFPDGWSPASQYPVFFTDESVEVYIETWNHPPEQNPVVSMTELLSGASRHLQLGGSRRAQNPWRVHTWGFSPTEDLGVYRVDAHVNKVTCSRSFLVTQQTRGWRNVQWEKHKGVQVLGTLYPHMNALEFAAENLAADADRGLHWGPFRQSWPGQPWCNFHPNPFAWLPNGVHYREWLSSSIQDLSRHVWTGERLTISASLVDGFNGVPWPEAVVQPQHLTSFVGWMKDRFDHQIERSTIDDLAELVVDELEPYWRLFVATELALPAHKIFRAELQKASPSSQVTDQFDLPQLPTLLKIPEVETFAQEWQSLFDISSMDPWNVRAGRGFHCPTYLSCLGKALAPEGKIGHYHMEMLGGDGPERISKMDRVFRQNVDLFWMMAANQNGEWVSVIDYPNGGGVSWLGGWETWLPLCHRGRRGGHAAYAEDWSGLERLYAIGEVVRPDRPRGFVLAACGPRLPVAGRAQIVTGDQARLFGALRDSGLPISGFARLDVLAAHTPVDGLVLPVTGSFSKRERAALSRCLTRGIPIGLVACGLDNRSLVELTGIPKSALAQGDISILRDGNIRGPFWDEGEQESYADLSSFVEELLTRTPIPVIVPRGIAWYAFESDHSLILILEELTGVSRDVIIETKAGYTPTRVVELLQGKEIIVDVAETSCVATLPMTASGAAVVMVQN